MTMSTNLAPHVALEELTRQLSPEELAQLMQLVLAHRAARQEQIILDEAVDIGQISGPATVAAGAFARASSPQGSVIVHGGQFSAPVIGVAETVVYGSSRDADERRHLIHYLSGLAARLDQLPLRVLDEQLSRGAGIGLSHIYVLLATTSTEVVATAPRSALSHFFVPDELTLRPAYNPDEALPDKALYVTAQPSHDGLEMSVAAGLADDEGDDQLLTLERRLLAIQAVQRHRRVVLLGAPGAGKSTFVRHLAWSIAVQGLGGDAPHLTAIPKESEREQLPILISLRALAGELAAHGLREHVVTATLRAEIAHSDSAAADELLSASLHGGWAMLLFDGLDEVPLAAMPGVSASRHETLEVVERFARRYPNVRVVITCRTRAFDSRLRDALSWPVETLAPFSLGQMRAFAAAWYSELVATGQIDAAGCAQLQEALIKAVMDNAKLRAMAETPLLLTMMTLLLYKRGMLPRDRSKLYEAVLELLLGQWDKVGKDGHSLGEALTLSDWDADHIRPLLDGLSYDAHRDAASGDGRGRLERATVRDRLIAFFERDYPQRSWALAQQCLDYIEQRSGLLLPDGPNSYAFAHLTLQEHCAGRHLLRDRYALRLLMEHRGDDRWREPILLGLGTIQDSNPWLIESFLRRLLDQREHERDKPADRWYRDLILAAEIGEDRNWRYLRDLHLEVAQLQDELRRGLVELLSDRRHVLPIGERVRAALLLGALGDPRYPVSITQWQDAIMRTLGGETDGYFCTLAPGCYQIGSADAGSDVALDERPQHLYRLERPLLVARYPVTQEQWAVWAAEGGEASGYAKDEERNHPNQPVVGVSWYAADAYCAWLTRQLHALGLRGVCVRLPSEQEWEAAASGQEGHCYPWGNAWEEDRAATEEDQEHRNAPSTVPVGCYPAGAAPCGASDMAGNVWEWTASVWQAYPGGAPVVAKEDARVLRGGSYWSDTAGVRCARRLWSPPRLGGYDHFGLRVVVEVAGDT
jgi:formylglycine-generating enzyme required for sulfatase activity